MRQIGTPHVVVVGAGLAGLSAAVACADGGARVTLFEGRPRFGGATWSFERRGLAFDNGQHVYLRCCTAYRRFLERLGTAELAPLQERLAIPVLSPSGTPGAEPEVAWIRRNSLPSPLHLAASLLAYRHLGLVDRAGIGRAALALRRLRLGDPALDAETFGAFLARHGQSPEAIQLLWDLIALPTVNVHASEASLALAAKVFQTGLLTEPDAADVGWARVPLSRLHVDPAVALLERLGATVHRRARVAAVEASREPGAQAPAVLVDGERVQADAVILAVPHEDAAGLLPAGGRVDPQALKGLGSSPIIDVHVVYDRKVTDHQIAAAVHSPVQFLFDRTAAAGMDPADGQCLAVSVSGADAEHGERPEVLIERYTAALADLFPAARQAKVVDAVVSREHAATFRGVPGTARLRPGPATGFSGLYLAGSWTDTGWPATMEGAVRSGVVASSCALSVVSSPRAVRRLPEEVVA
ncbi:MAG TPA: hydroxysqualene dehydroxylase HpnE [Acidimicrobiales bacterium]|nr:hydroxysqualene dehydroxylase HpnE [Acidimicrobiales bacterium]